MRLLSTSGTYRIYILQMLVGLESVSDDQDFKINVGADIENFHYYLSLIIQFLY